MQIPQTALNPVPSCLVLDAVSHCISAASCLHLPHQTLRLLLRGPVLSGITAFTMYLTNIASCAHCFLSVSLSFFLQMNTSFRSFSTEGSWPHSWFGWSCLYFTLSLNHWPGCRLVDGQRHSLTEFMPSRHSLLVSTVTVSSFWDICDYIL